MRFLVTVRTGALAALLAAPAGAALADAIDGNWCYTDGRKFSINGPTIVTPGGTRMAGIYDRHAFSYVVPKAEAGAGSKIDMSLVDDDTLHLRPGAAAKIQVWRRCKPVS